ncbi:MAG TPA: geranylgeranylglycerol-phosphate geranylgeranyltransferase [Cyclobacteriaceae bacterium]|jgi:4-hydroxybenzoate polyprenyltransferase|nr:geranylgeranylglycerol-phosphate geranylgeranyltransferase [Cyclobacteriaceae bacterium]
MLTEKGKNLLASILKLTRFGNLLIIVLAQYFTAGFLVIQWRDLIFNFHFFLLCSSTVLIAAAGYIINDYYDVKIDFVNKPDRVVIGKSITRRFAILYHVIFSSLGILIGLYLSWRVAAVNVFSVFLLWLYSNNLKRQPFIGNLSVAFLTGLSIYVVEVFFRTGNSFVIIYASFSFFMTLVREIIKDMEDLKGDNIFGCRTLPIVWGVRKTKMIIYGILAILASTVLLLNEFYTRLPIHYFILFLFVPLIWLLTRLIRADTTKDYAWLSNFCKIIMLLGILSMAFV